MTRRTNTLIGGYFGIGIYQVKRAENLGLLWRSAYQLGASFVFTIGARYKPQPSDVFNTWQHIPLFSYATLADFLAAPAYDCPIVAVEEKGQSLLDFQHPHRAIYLLGAEDNGLPNAVLQQCHFHITIPSIRAASYNVAQAGALVMFDRMYK
ncbi:MAG: RNA methyltransferase [Caldilineaceae bacterium]|nr:RNA methyltransferase [Caldilineaceae bacterium]